VILDESVLEQSIFLSSILAGFGLAIAAQLALERDTDRAKREIAIDLMRSSLLCVLSVIVGIVYLTMIPVGFNAYLKALLIIASTISLIVAIVYFVRSIDHLATIGFGLSKSWVVRFLVRWTVFVLMLASIATALIYWAVVAGYL
jgi:hypothetical protein